MAMSLALSSCDIYSILGISTYDDETPAVTRIVNGDEVNDDAVASYTPSSDGVYSPTSVLPYSYREMSLTSGADLVIPTGDVTILVLPIEFSDYSFSSTIKSDLNIALNGNSTDQTTGYWESLASFYNKTSFGKLNLSFEIADIYKATLTAQEAAAENDSAVAMVKRAVSHYKANQSATHLDKDKNGLIDGVIAVYSCPNYSNSSAISRFDKEGYFWAYCYWNVASVPLVSSPDFNVYFWLSYDFLYNKYKQIDAHTMIHEFGHMLGLDDYYPNDKSANAFYPLGLLDMMDGNILDHNVFSKAALGWLVPKVVDGTKTITLKPSQENGDCILIPSGQWNGSMWSEYIMVELYTPDGLNKLDASKAYDNRPIGFTRPGIKIYHVDARVVSGSIASGEKDYSYAYHNGTTLSPINERTRFRYYRIGASNCYKDSNIVPEAYSLIHLLESSGRVTFKTSKYATDSSLFHAGDTFSMSKFSSCFPRSTTLNCGAEFPYTIKVDSLSDSSATLTITKA